MAGFAYRNTKPAGRKWIITQHSRCGYAVSHSLTFVGAASERIPSWTKRLASVSRDGYGMRWFNVNSKTWAAPAFGATAQLIGAPAMRPVAMNCDRGTQPVARLGIAGHVFAKFFPDAIVVHFKNKGGSGEIVTTSGAYGDYTAANRD